MQDGYSNPLNCIPEGKGEITLVFLHYFGGSSKSWSGVIDVLKKSFHCVAINLRGFGDSPKPYRQLSVYENAKDVLDVIQGLKLRKYVLIGHSMGGKVALCIGSQKSPGLECLILIAPTPPTPEPTTDKDRKDLLAAFGDPVAIKKLIKKITAKPLTGKVFEETVQDHFRVAETAWKGWIEKGSREDISSLMQNINIPVLVVSGAQDPNFSTKFLRKEFEKYFSSASFEELQDAGHLLPVEVPVAVAASISNFIRTCLSF